jgi:hypothetical protein
MRALPIKTLAIAAVTALGTMAATVAPASAHFTTTRCDRDGDDCYTVRCDDDGDDCHRIYSYPRHDYYRRGYYGNHSGAYGYGNEFGFYLNSGRYAGDRYDGYSNDYYNRFGRGDYDDDDE